MGPVFYVKYVGHLQIPSAICAIHLSEHKALLHNGGRQNKKK